MTGTAHKNPPDDLPRSDAETLPQLLTLNAAARPGRDAMREKSFGIWRRWTW